MDHMTFRGQIHVCVTDWVCGSFLSFSSFLPSFSVYIYVSVCVHMWICTALLASELQPTHMQPCNPSQSPCNSTPTPPCPEYPRSSMAIDEKWIKMLTSQQSRSQ